MSSGFVFLITAFLIGSSNAQWYLPREAAFPFINSFLCFVTGVFLLFLGFRITARYPSDSDHSFPWNGFWLLLCLAGAVFLRLYHMDVLFGGWWADQAREMACGWDSFINGHIPFVYDWGSRPSFPTCFEITLFRFFPHLTGPQTLKLSATLIDLLSLTTFYFLGREVGGKRTGLFMAAMGMISREMLDKLFLCFDIPIFAWVVSLSLLVLFRLIHKPTFWRFIQWGVVTVFGLYAYNAYRPWVSFLLVTVCLWILSHPQERKWGFWGYGAVLGPMFAGLIWFLRVGRLITENSFFGSAKNDWFCWVLLIWGLVSMGRIAKEYKKRGYGRLFLGFGLGMASAAVTFYPFSITPEFAKRTNEIIDLKPMFHPAEFFSLCSRWVAELVNVLFVEGRDFSSVGPDHQTFFSLHAIVLIFLGLTFLAAKPSRGKLWLLLAAIPGVLPYVLVINSHTGRLMGLIPPMYLLASLGLNRFWEIFSQKSVPSILRVLGIAFLGFFWVWGGWANFRSVWAWSDMNGSVVNIYRRALSERGNGRVYLAKDECYSFFYDLDTLIEHQDIYRFCPFNPIYLQPEEKTPDVIVFCNNDKKNIDLLRSNYPRAQWTQILDRPPQANLPFYFCWKVHIPGDQIDPDSRKLFFTRPMPPNAWKRKFYLTDYGIASGVIFFEDAVTNLETVFRPKEATWLISVSLSVMAERKFKVEIPGPYVFSIKTTQPFQLSLENGREYEIFNRNAFLRKNPKHSRTIRLEKGTYQVRYGVLPIGDFIPPLTVRYPDGSISQW